MAHSTFVGPPGSGKSSFIDRLLGRRRKQSSSTGVCSAIIRVNIDVTKSCPLQAVNILESNVWKEVECNESLVAQMDVRNEPEGTESFIKPEVIGSFIEQETHPELTEGFEEFIPNVEENVTPNAPAQSAEKAASLTAATTTPPIEEIAASLPIKSKVITLNSNDDTRSVIKKYGFKKFKKYLKKTFSLYLRDTGGQVEFQEILGLLVFGPSIIFFLFNITLGFQEKFSIEYRVTASESTNCYTSSITTEEALLQCLSTVYAMDTSSESRVKTHKPLVFIVGTHIDELQARIKDKDLDAETSKLNQYLDSLLIKNGFRDLVEYYNADECKVMFTINNMSDSDNDFKKVRTRVNNLIKGRDEFTIRYPLKYLLFCLDLQFRKECVLTLKECKAMAAVYGITGDQVIDLLHFLHFRISVIRYFDVKGLRNIIIKEPQVLFNKVTDLIIETFSSTILRDRERNDFKKRGIFSASSFENIVKTDDKITSNEFLQLLVHLRIIASFPTQEGQEKKFFMPCVLNHVPASNSTVHTDILPLAITFERQHCPKGVFGVLVTHIMTPESDLKAEYQTEFQFNEERIFKDQVSFNVISCEAQEDEISIKVNPSHLEINFFPYSLAEEREVSIEEVCSTIHEILEKLIIKSFKNLHYNEERVKPIMCLRCELCDELHQVNKAKKMTCKKNRKSIRIPSQGRYWYNKGQLMCDSTYTTNSIAMCTVAVCLFVVIVVVCLFVLSMQVQLIVPIKEVLNLPVLIKKGQN